MAMTWGQLTRGMMLAGAAEWNTICPPPRAAIRSPGSGGSSAATMPRTASKEARLIRMSRRAASAAQGASSAWRSATLRSRAASSSDRAASALARHRRTSTSATTRRWSALDSLTVISSLPPGLQ